MSEVSLSIRLRESSMDAHKHAEGSSFIKDLFQGKCSDEKYAQYIWALREVYQTLESAMTANQNQAQVSCVYYPELFRTEPLNNDLKVWSEGTVSENLKQAVSEYKNHLLQLQNSKPHLLVSHAYVRYLGDLSGGQILGKILSKRFPENKGLNFYNYGFSDFTERKNVYRSQLDFIGEQVPQYADDLCSEVITAFKLNERIFESLN